MKALLLLGFSLSTAAFACPDLSGDYLSCQVDNLVGGEDIQLQQISIRQLVEQGATYYNLHRTFESGESSLELFKADAQPYVSPFWDYPLSVTTCTDDVVTLKEGGLSPEGSFKADRVFGFNKGEGGALHVFGLQHGTGGVFTATCR